MSALRETLAEYIATTQALGAKNHKPALMLERFVDFLEREGAAVITTEIALRWATEPRGVQTTRWARRLSIVRRFAVWAHATDSRTEIPPPRLLPARSRRKPPHIYSDLEIARLMAATAQLPSRTGLRPATYTTLIGLLASTGLRPGEALALNEPDVDLRQGILAVRNTKFGKSRFVPVMDSVRSALASYAARRDGLVPHRQAGAFLLNELGSRLAPSSARRTFAALTRAVGLRPAEVGGRSGHGPRMQDLRHTFATRRLVAWYRAGLDAERLMPALATYLGHRHVQDTYWYIEAVPELLELATEYQARRSAGGGR